MTSYCIRHTPCKRKCPTGDQVHRQLVFHGGKNLNSVSRQCLTNYFCLVTSEKMKNLLFLSLIAFANGLINAKKYKKPARFYCRLTETKNGPLKCSGTLIDMESVLTGWILAKIN